MEVPQKPYANITKSFVHLAAQICFMKNCWNPSPMTAITGPCTRHYHPTLSIWLSVDPMADKYPGVSPYTYCGNNPVVLKDPDGRDWFENENTGEVYYARDYRKGDEHLIDGDGWKWMGKNDMFGKPADDIITANLDKADVYTQGDSYGRVGFRGNYARKFMSNMGYVFRPKTESVKIIETTTMVSEPHGPIYLTVVEESLVRRTGTYTKNTHGGAYTVLSKGPTEDRRIGLVVRQSIHTEIRQYDYSQNQVNRKITSTAIRLLGEVLKLGPLVK